MSSAMLENEEIIEPIYNQWRHHADKVLKRSNEFYEGNQLCDVILIAGNDGKRVPAHRLILSASSDYFYAMFTSSMRESKDNEVTMNELSGDTLQDIVKYCYTGSIEVEENTVEALLASACMLQLEPIVNACIRFLERQMDSSNCLGFAYIAEHFNCDSLLKKSQNYALQNFQSVTNEQEFYELNVKQLGELLNSDYLNVSCEEDVFTNLMAWVHYDEVNRKNDIPKLLQLVRLVLLKPSFIVDHVLSICKENCCTDMLTDICKWHMVPERRRELSFDCNTIQRKSTIGRLLAIASQLSSFRISIQMYCPLTQKWTMWQNIVSDHNEFATALIGFKLYFVGGRHKFKTTNLVQSFDIVTLALSPVPSMFTCRRELCVAELNGFLYAIGGIDGINYLQTVERFDPNQRTWSSVAPMKKKRANAGVAVHNGRLYVIGGQDGFHFHDSMECYNWYTNKWSLLQPMQRKRSCLGVTAVNGYIYAVGGQCGIRSPTRTSSVEYYDTINDKWTAIYAVVPTECDQFRCTSLGDRLVVIGGHDGNQFLTKVMEYDHLHSEWNDLAPLPMARSSGGIVVIPNIEHLNNTNSPKGVKYII